MAIIGISGKIGSGKDTIGEIIQYLIYCNKNNIPFTYPITNQHEKTTNNSNIPITYTWKEESDWKIRKFATTLKRIVSLLIGCSLQQLEDHEFKNKELGEEWWFYGYGDLKREIYNIMIPYLEAYNKESTEKYLVKLTPRKLLQLLGTDCGRDIIHPNIWVNSLFSDYKAKYIKEYDGRETDLKSALKDNNPVQQLFPNWIVTDLRFLNELKAIEDRDGITIRINRYPLIIKNEDGTTGHLTREDYNKLNNITEHESETALDNANFKYTIDNNGSIEELVEKVKEILIKENII